MLGVTFAAPPLGTYLLADLEGGVTEGGREVRRKILEVLPQARVDVQLQPPPLCQDPGQVQHGESPREGGPQEGRLVRQRAQRVQLRGRQALVKPLYHWRMNHSPQLFGRRGCGHEALVKPLYTGVLRAPSQV
eukprot:1194926-Prorocentrum_minimum.AAC.1